jgi:hypothetical protein
MAVVTDMSPMTIMMAVMPIVMAVIAIEGTAPGG